LNHKASGLAHHAAGGQNVNGIDVHFKSKIVLAGFYRHDNFFQRTITGTLTQAGLVRCIDFDTLETLAEFTAYEGAVGLNLVGR
jgi:hypothetical protein